MFTRRRIAGATRSIALTVLLLAIAGLGCKKQPEAEPAKAEVAAPPKATPKAPEPVDLAKLSTALEQPSELNAALGAYAELSAALAEEGRVRPEDREAAETLLRQSRFPIVAQAALSGGDVAAAAKALGLPADATSAPAAFKALAAELDAEAAEKPAVELLAWLTADSATRAAAPAPTLKELGAALATSGPAGDAVAAAAARYMEQTLRAAASTAADQRVAGLGQAFGALACGACSKLGSLPPEDRAAALFAADDTGVVCEAARTALAGKALYEVPGILAESCPPEAFGLTDAGAMRLLTPGNAVVLRALVAGAAPVGRTASESSPFTKLLADAKGALQQQLDKLAVPLALPWQALPTETWAARAEEVLAPAHLEPLRTRRPALPLETLVVDEKGVGLAMRPVAIVKEGSVSLLSGADEMMFPGKQLIARDAVEASDESRDAAAKKAGEKVADEDVIVEVAAGLEAAKSSTDPIAARAFAGAAPEQRNPEREAGSRTVTLAVDTAAPAWLLRRALASAAASGYGYALAYEPSLADLEGQSVLPLVFRTTERLAEGTAIQVYKQPTIVYLTKRAVEIYPPDKRAGDKREIAGDDPGWPEGAKTKTDKKKRLFSVTIALPEAKEPVRGAVAQAVQKMERDYGAGNVVYVTAESGASAGRLLEIVDALTYLPGPALPQPAALEPGLVCEEEGCPTHVPVLFPDVRIPKLKEEGREPPPPPGYCSAANIKRVIGRREGSFRFCYERELQLEPTLKGRVTVRFTIDEGGLVTKLGILSSTLKNRRVETCILGKFRGMRFDKPKGGVCIVKWPLKFTH